MVLGEEFESYCAEETLNARDRNSDTFWGKRGALDESIVRVRWEYARHGGDGTSPSRRGKWARDRKYEGRIIGDVNVAG